MQTKINTKKIFMETFAPIMSEQGFNRYNKNLLFARVHGNILQGIRFKANRWHDFEICVTFHPYWIHNFTGVHPSDCDLSKGLWAQIHFSGIAMDSSPFIEYDATEQECRDGIKQMLDIFQKEILPLLERITDEESFISAQFELVDYWEQNLRAQDGRFIGAYRPFSKVNEHILLYKAWHDGTYEQTDQILERITDNWRIRERRVCRNPDQIQSEITRLIGLHYSKYLALRDAGDFHTIQEIYNSEEGKIRGELKSFMGIEV